MKFSNKISKILLFVFCLTNIGVILSLTSKSYAVFSFNNSNVSLNGPSQNNFKGHVGLDTEGKGLVITAGDGGQNEGLLRLVSEKMDTDSYLVDYRLLRSCNIGAKIAENDKNLKVSFSPKSLENRNKNDKFDIQVEIFNYRSFLSDAAARSEEDIKKYLKDQCLSRKNFIADLKKRFNSSVSDFRLKYKEIKDLSKKFSSQAEEVENLRSAINDAEAQIKDIKYLQNSYEMQLKSISSITTGAHKLISKEHDKKVILMTQQKELDNKITENLDLIKQKEEALTKLKDKYAKTMEQSKEVENLIISNQKDLSEVDNDISNLKSNRLRFKFDLKNAEANRQSTNDSVNDINHLVKEYKQKNEEVFDKMNKFNVEKANMVKFIAEEKEDIKQLEIQINELILKKSKKEENLKNKYDQIKNKEEQITNLKFESEEFINKIKRLIEKKEKLEGNEKVDINSRIENLKTQISTVDDKISKLDNNQKNIKENLKTNNTKKDLINKKINDHNKDIEQVNNDIVSLNKKRMNLDKRKSDLNVEIRDKEGKLKNLRTESENYTGDIENVKKSLNSAQENLQTFTGILNDFKNKLTPVETSYKSLETEKNNLEQDVKDLKKSIKETALELKRNTPSAVVMIDLAEDEALNDNFDDDGKAKWRVLIDKIIS